LFIVKERGGEELGKNDDNKDTYEEYKGMWEDKGREN
jgi:hypothetical protein